MGGQGAPPADRYHAGVATRYRCTTCGNLTRFDVETSRRTRAFHHYTVGGDLTVEDETAKLRLVIETAKEVWG